MVELFKNWMEGGVEYGRKMISEELDIDPSHSFMRALGEYFEKQWVLNGYIHYEEGTRHVGLFAWCEADYFAYHKWLKFIKSKYSLSGEEFIALWEHLGTGEVDPSFFNSYLLGLICDSTTFEQCVDDMVNEQEDFPTNWFSDGYPLHHIIKDELYQYYDCLDLGNRLLIFKKRLARD